jgi:hypothetical protein
MNIYDQVVGIQTLISGRVSATSVLFVLCQTAIQDKITEYRIRWSAHPQRMDNSRLPKQALLYKPRGRRYVGSPRKRWTADV